MGGFFGTVSKDDCVRDLFFGTDYHSHLGTSFGGLVVSNGEKLQREIHTISNDQFRSKLGEFAKNTRGNKGIGVISDHEEQPLKIDSHLGTYSIVHVGKVTNLEELAGIAKGRMVHFAEVSGIGVNPTEVIASLINQGKNFKDGLEIVQNHIKGSSSLMLLTDDGIYLARDKFGRTPIAVGRKKNGNAMAATLETFAFQNLDFEFERQLGPGEIVRMDEGGCEQLKKPEDKMAICSFLWVYYGYPASNYEGRNVEVMRNDSGAAHGKIDMGEGLKIDVVAGIPDSGTGHAIGFANETKTPYQRPYTKYTPTWPRSFMPQNQDERNLVAKMKLIAIEELIRGKRVLFCEDSIVRGTQLREVVNVLFEEYGANEVHMRSACPPLINSCDFLNFSRSKDVFDLAARRAIREIGGESADVSEYINESSSNHRGMVDEIRRDLKFTSLRYQKMGDMVSAIGLPKDKLCTHCFDGCSSGACSSKLYDL